MIKLVDKNQIFAIYDAEGMKAFYEFFAGQIMTPERIRELCDLPAPEIDYAKARLYTSPIQVDRAKTAVKDKTKVGQVQLQFARLVHQRAVDHLVRSPI